MSRSQFVVPQFLDVEPKIIGPITLRQFLIMVGVIVAEFLVYRIFLSLLPMLAVGIPIAALGGAFAFGKVNGQPLHYIVLNLLQYIKKPAKRVWDKTLSDTDLRVYLKKVEEEKPPEKLRKAPLESSRLSELTLIVNTGGVYKGDDELPPQV
ncbi:PrgI family protein [bacterium]|jgi:hypothetical protein|nr:PrgI family protein [bacterium]NBX49212.1 PrgI family protein [bacterium]